MSYFRDERKKRKVILVGQVVVKSVQLCMSTTCMGANVPFPPKKRKTKVVSQSKNKKKSLPVLRCYTRSLFRMDRSFGGAVGHHNIDFDT